MVHNKASMTIVSFRVAFSLTMVSFLFYNDKGVILCGTSRVACGTSVWYVEHPCGVWNIRGSSQGTWEVPQLVLIRTIY